MTALRQADCRNLLIQAMRPEDFALIAPHLERTAMKTGDVLASAGDPFDCCCFPESGIITFSERLSNGTRIGIGHIGYEGCAGWPIVLGCRQSAHEARVTADGGGALRIPEAALVEASGQSETLRGLLLRFVQTFIVQLGRTIVSNLTQPVEDRLARWTLMAHDRVQGDDIKVTHEEIAVMLAIRRASVTDALHVLEGEGLIRSQRGLVTVRNREGLLRHAGETYGAFEAEYSRLIAPFPRQSDKNPEKALPRAQ